MKIHNQKEALVLLVGDLALFFVSLYCALLIRFLALPEVTVFVTHLLPFLLLFVAGTFVFYIAGLYENHTLIFRSRLPSILFNAQLANITIAVAFFYFIPFFGITPKTILFIYLSISSVCILLWRLFGSRFIVSRRKENALIIGGGEEMRELRDEINHNSRYSIRFTGSFDPASISSIDFQEEVVKKVYAEGITLIVVDLHDDRIEPILPRLYNLIFSGVQFVDMHRLYEDTFLRIPLSLIKDNWFLENISASSRATYDIAKRAMDILLAIPLLVVPIILYPIVLVAMKIEDGGPAFTRQRRVGRNNKIVEFIKFRTMLFNDDGQWADKGKENKVTRVGAFLRKTRLDEFPQLWNVLKGDASLIGPRPEFPEPVKHYTEEVPYYNVRHLIKPGLSGWAQLYGEHAHHGVDVNKTANKLSYDLFYIKNRSFMLDVKIAFRTIQVLFSRSGV